jgi:serpin B
MPHDPAKIDAIVGELNFDQIKSYLEKADTSTVHLYLPKFKVEYDLSLKPVLSTMGMASSFVQGDFSNLFEESLILAIDDVLHKAFIEVDEEGTEAAAATVVVIVELSAGGGGKPRIVSIDQPFIFFIREKHSNTILFAGKMLDPTMGN